MKKIYPFDTFFSFHLRITSTCQMMMSDNPTLLQPAGNIGNVAWLPRETEVMKMWNV